VRTADGRVRVGSTYQLWHGHRVEMSGEGVPLLLIERVDPIVRVRLSCAHGRRFEYRLSVAVITGVGGGIGRALGERVAVQGRHVLGVSRDLGG
jgi:hypothetical protein